MFLLYFFVRFSSFFSLTIASHFLGGSFTYRHVEQSVGHGDHRVILVELRFHISDHYFLCTPEQVNSHMVAYVVGEAVPFDNVKKVFLWHEAEAVIKNKNFYDVKCLSTSNQNGCKDFQEKVWAYCESANRENFMLSLETASCTIGAIVGFGFVLWPCSTLLENSSRVFY